MSEQGEQELNTRLRRVDWRFLLPTPRPRRAFCRAGAVLTSAVASIAGELVTGAAAGDCDLAVGEHPNRPQLAELRDALRPGGACYTEWHLPIGQARRVARALEGAGFTDVTCYRPWPGEGALPVYWIPLDAPGAARYARSRRRLRGGRVRRLLAAVRGWPGHLLGGTAAGRVCAIARRPGSRLLAGLDPAAWLREGWSAWGLGPAPAQLSTLLVTGGLRSVNKVVVLAFAEPGPTPVVAVKAPRVEEAAAGVRREGAALASVAADRSVPIRGVPRILSLRETDGIPWLSQTALAGRPLESVLAPRNLGAWSLKVADWLAALGQGGPTLPAAHWRETIVEPAMGRFADLFGPVADPGLLREGEGIVRAIGALPRVPEQRDFGPWNVLVTPGGELAVLDWESAEVGGLPALDLLYYLTYAGFTVDRARDAAGRLASYHRLLNASTRTGAVRRDCLARYLDALGLVGMPLAPLRVLLWLIHAQSEFRRAASDAAGTPPAGVIGRSLFLSLWELEVRDAAGR
jgi:hypothetical protein